MNRIFKLGSFLIFGVLISSVSTQRLHAQKSGNPVFEGWYADPEGIIIDTKYWIYPTYSAPYEQQTFMDAYSSPDLVNWTKHSRIVDSNQIKWANKAMWAPSIIKKDSLYYLFFAANDIQNNTSVGGIGVGVSDKPEGPFKDHLGKPLLDKFHNGAQPIDQFVFQDVDKQYYMIYGGWGHCNIVKLKDDFTGFLPFSDNTTFKEITPSGYVEGPIMFRRNNKYYFMWSEGGWTTSDYRVAYAISDSPFGPFVRIGLILQQDASIATGAGHHSVLNYPGTDDWYIVYHRRPLGITDGNARVTCVDRMVFNTAGKIIPVTMTFEGVNRRFLDGPVTVYTGSGFSGDSVKLDKDDYLNSNLLSMGLTEGSISSVKVKEGYQVDLFDGDTYKGNSIVLSDDASTLIDQDFENKTKSLIVRRGGISSLSGTYCLQNKESGLYMMVKNDLLTNGTNIVQSNYSGKPSQQFNLLNVGGGYYKIEAVESKKILSIAKSSKDAGAILQQWDNGFTDITHIGGVITAQYLDSPASETIEKLVDNSTGTKYLTGHSQIWIQFNVSGKAAVTEYTITSANDSPERDPLNWVLKGSNDELTWDTLDTQNGVDFTTRLQNKSFTCQKSSDYKYYRFDMKNNSGVNTQIAELELLGTPTAGAFQNQQFVFQPVENGYFKIFNNFSDKLLDVVLPVAPNAVRQNFDTNLDVGKWILRRPEEAAALDKVSEMDIRIIPNPVGDLLNVKGTQDNTQFEVFNSVGMKVKSADIPSIDVKNLQPGAYFLRLQTRNGILNMKFIKK